MLIRLYADSPNYKEVAHVVAALRDGAVIIYPTVTGYAYCCDALQPRAVEAICSLKGIDPRKKSLAIMFAGLSEVSEYCKMNDRVFKFIKEHTGNYTFILPPAGSLPKLFKSRKEVGVRLAQHPVGKLILEELGNPLITSSLPIGELDPEYITDPELVYEQFGDRVALVVNGGIVAGGVSTVVDCTTEPFEILRLGGGRIDAEEFVSVD